MASITIRNLDEATKQALRERAARNGNSMEEEVRLLLNELNQPQPFRAVSSAAEVEPHSIDTSGLAGKRILLIIGGGIAAYKCLDLIRRLRERGAVVRPVLTPAAEEFVTPLSVGAISGDKVFTDLFDREDEHDIGHIRLSREADLIVVAPATADMMAKMANGHANDLASTVLMATNKPVLIAPAMNPQMWSHSATQRNRVTLANDGIHMIGPNAGEMAESGEAGIGRMAEPMQLVEAIAKLISPIAEPKPLAGKRAILTSGPTHEPIDPVRYIANRSSGKQGHAIAEALANAGAEVILVSGPVAIPNPKGVETIRVQTAREMQAMVEASLPADIAIMVAAVADWRSADEADEKMKKENGKGPDSLKLVENPDILKGLGHHKKRPSLLIGFAAETEKLEKHAKAKLKRKNADWIVANDVSPEGGVMGGDRNTVKLISNSDIEAWPTLGKVEVAERLVQKIIDHFDVETLEA
ncbi:MAG: bifunctional phosphopantothenoylcysteine decarboxylase/phosphopantothenate--cysteine ligase CoaBC [Rhizobiaceae bacterium]|nr:bifunctional phosphopantothenoylcysteine decarboxylase/phosphopantothenate--cysteine ligase CoaBC [Rhizobiaceae bacterium]